jgi:hypothetical protein
MLPLKNGLNMPEGSQVAYLNARVADRSLRSVDNKYGMLAYLGSKATGLRRLEDCLLPYNRLGKVAL